MKSKKQLIFVLLTAWMIATTHAHAQKSEIENLFHDLETMDAGTQGPFDKADPVLKQLAQANKEDVVAALPVILRATSDPHLSVRRVAAFALYEIAARPDGQALLSGETATFTTLLVDPDTPIRRITGMAIEGLHPDANSPLVPILEAFLAREDAVSTIGAGVATVLLKAAPNDTDSISAVVQFMRRKDQTSASRYVILDAITNVAKSHNSEIAKAVATYADDPDDQTSVHAIQTLRFIGQGAVIDNQQTLSRIAGDPRRSANVRAAATRALTTIQ